MHLDLDGQGWAEEHGVHMLIGRDYRVHYVRAPRGLRGIAEGTKLEVLRQFVSGPDCPLGTGRLCLDLERGVRAVFAGDKGVARLQPSVRRGKTRR